MVVALSRNEHSRFITIVTDDKEKAMKSLYDTLCIRTQWTALKEAIVERLSVSGNEENRVCGGRRTCSINLPELYPYRVCDITLPTSNSGYVYLLVSTICPEQVYVGQTINIAVRLQQHNSGYGASGTACPDYLPWYVAAYMTNMGHMSLGERMAIETKWQVMNRLSIRQGRTDFWDLIENGKRITDEYNDAAEEEKEDECILFVVCVQRIRST